MRMIGVILLLLFLSPLPILRAQTFTEPEASNGIAVSLIHLLTIETELDLEFSISLSASSSHIDLSKPVQKGKSSDVPGIIRVTGGAYEVMLDIEIPDIEEGVGNDSVKIYDFDVGHSGAGQSVVVLPNVKDPSFTVAIGAKAEIFGDDNLGYLGETVLSANYL